MSEKTLMGSIALTKLTHVLMDKKGKKDKAGIIVFLLVSS